MTEPSTLADDVSYAGLGSRMAPSDTTAQVASVLRAAILEGQLASGTPLREVVLAAELGVSRNTVREAARILSAESLVRHQRNKGFIVSDVDDVEIDEIYQAREAIERVGVQSLAGSRDSGALTELEAVVARIEAAFDAADVTAAVANDRAFHAALVAHTGNGHLIKIHEGLQRELRLALTLAERSARTLGRISDDHRILLDAIRNGDVAHATDTLSQHLRDGADELHRQRGLIRDQGQRH